MLDTKPRLAPFGSTKSLYGNANHIKKDTITISQQINTFCTARPSCGLDNDPVLTAIAVKKLCQKLRKITLLTMINLSNGLNFANKAAIQRFTACHACDQGNRRGLGFDKPQLEGSGPTCLCVSPRSFGHTGFTGTFAWADPESGIVLVFLSNRVYPDASVNKLAQMGIRTQLQEVVQSALR